MFDYPHLEFLLAIEREGDFERAAKTLGVTKPYISQRLRLLEERIGGIAVCRDSIKLTEFGHRLCRHFENVRIHELSYLNNNADLFTLEDPGPVTLKVAVGNESLESWFKSALVGLHSSKDRFFLDIFHADECEIEREMNRGGVHAAITSTKQKPAGFSSHYLGRHVFRATASPEFIQRHFPSGITNASLLEAPSMKTSKDDPLREKWITRVIGDYEEKDISIVPSVHALVNRCVEGAIWAVNSSLLVDKHLEENELVELDPCHSLETDLHWHISKFVSDTMSDLTDAVLSAAREQLVQPNLKVTSCPR